jgi:hypothetical protein
MGHKNLLIFIYLIFGTSSFIDYGRFIGAEARYFSEGGGFNLPQQQKQQVQQQQGPYFSNYYDQLGSDYNQLEQQQPKQQQQPQQYGYDSEQQLSQIIDELNARSYEEEQAKAAQELEEAIAQQQFLKQQPEEKQPQAQQHDDAFDKLQELTNEVKQIAATAAQKGKDLLPEALKPESAKPEQGEQESAPLQLQTKPEQPLTPMKKGQSEYVEFIEPLQSKALKGVETMDKRVVAESSGSSNIHGVKLLSSTGNIMFIAVVTVCSVFVVAGVVGGAYYYNNSRKSGESDFDDFTRYSPAGPGKKLQGFRNGIRMDENGDDSLAYKAQLHHYQQTKQKIIGGDDGLSPSTTPTGGMASPRSIHHNENSEDEAEDLEEHNYSVYECPGLAPTGDIEVSNPNFGHHH